MVKSKREKYGYITCPTPKCGARLVVKKSERGTLSWFCQECDGRGYAKHGDAGFKAWDDAVTDKVTARAPDPKPAPAPASRPAPAPDPKPAPAPAPKAAPAPARRTLLG